jgi:hypothetical protein
MRYWPRRPSQSVLYRGVQQHLETWLAECRDCHDDDAPVPPYVEQEFRRHLDCGILARGFARARCGQCGHDFLIAVSCKGRGVCPSCSARHMVETAAHLTDHVLPELPLRQWVLAVPKRLHCFLQRDPGRALPYVCSCARWNPACACTAPVQAPRRGSTRSPSSTASA